MALARDPDAVVAAKAGMRKAAEEMLYARSERQNYRELQAVRGIRMYPKADDSYRVEYHPEWWPRWIPRFEAARVGLERATCAVGRADNAAVAAEDAAVAGARALGRVGSAARARVLALDTPPLVALEKATPLERSLGELAARDDVAAWHAALRTVVPESLDLEEEQKQLTRRELSRRLREYDTAEATEKDADRYHWSTHRGGGTPTRKWRRMSASPSRSAPAPPRLTRHRRVTAPVAATLLSKLDGHGSSLPRLVGSFVTPSIPTQMALARDPEAVVAAKAGMREAAVAMLRAEKYRERHIVWCEECAYPRPAWPTGITKYWSKWVPWFTTAVHGLEAATAAVGRGDAAVGERALGPVGRAARGEALAVNIAALEGETEQQRAESEPAARDALRAWHEALVAVVPGALTRDAEREALAEQDRLERNERTRVQRASEHARHRNRME